MSFDFSLLKQRWETERREATRRSETLKSLLMEKGIPILKRYGVEKVVLFGSIAEGTCHDNSDIDLLVLPLSAERFWRCLSDLQQSIGRQVDLYTQSDDPVFVKKILERGKTIYETQPRISHCRSER